MLSTENLVPRVSRDFYFSTRMPIFLVVLDGWHSASIDSQN